MTVVNMGGQESDDEDSSVSTLVPSTVIEPVAALQEIDNAMSGYIYVTLLTQTVSGNLSRTVDIELTDAERNRAAVLASELDGRLDSNFRIEKGRVVRDAYVETGPSGNRYHGMSV